MYAHASLAWQDKRNAANIHISWSFTTTNARSKRCHHNGFSQWIYWNITFLVWGATLILGGYSYALDKQKQPIGQRDPSRWLLRACVNSASV